jgi:hypothetical protein
MANLQLLPYAQQVAAIERQRKLADLLQQQGMEQEQTQTAGRFVVPTSPWQTVAKLAQAGLGAYLEGKAAKRESELDTQQREEAKKAIQDFMAASGPQKTVTQTPIMEQDFGQAATPEDYQNMMNNPQMGLAPKRRDVSLAETPEDVQDIVNQPYVTKDVTSYTPGLSRNEQIAKLLEMQAGGNKYVSAAVPTLTGLMPKSPEVGAVNPADWTPASLAKYASTGNYNDLVPKVTAEKPAALPSAVQEYEYAKDQGYTGSYTDFMKLGKASSNLTVNMPATNKYGETVGTKTAEAEEATLTSSASAPEQIASSHRIKSLLEQNPITGAGANFKLGAKKLAVLAGFADPNDDEITATDSLISELAKGTLASVKSSGLGAGNGFTDNDLRFLEKATIGNVELSSKTLEYLINKYERAARESITKGNAIRARRRKMPELQGIAGSFEDIPMPAEYKSTNHYGAAPAGAVRQR